MRVGGDGWAHAWVDGQVREHTGQFDEHVLCLGRPRCLGTQTTRNSQGQGGGVQGTLRGCWRCRALGSGSDPVAPSPHFNTIDGFEALLGDTPEFIPGKVP